MSEIVNPIEYKFGKFVVLGTNKQELRQLKQEIFDQEIYGLPLNTKTPFIIDAGAHVGLTCLYFMSRYPESTIIALEPLPQNQQLLKQNLWANHLDEGVTLIPKALDRKVGERLFYFDATADQWYSTAGFTNGAWDKTQTSNSLMAQTTTLDEIIGDKTVDLLKLDIEGAELDVLQSGQHLLPQINNLIIEVHNSNHNPRLLHFLSASHHCITTPISKGLNLIRASLR